MEPVTTMALAISLTASMQVASLELVPTPLMECRQSQSRMAPKICVEIEPPCGKSIGVECFGRAEEAKPRTKKIWFRSKTGKKVYRTVRQ